MSAPEPEPAPRPDRQQLLADLTELLAGLPGGLRAGPRVNLFEAGMDSVTGTRLCLLAGRRLRMLVPVRLVLENPRLADLADAIAELLEAAPDGRGEPG